jgi:hypothetical protein
MGHRFRLEAADPGYDEATAFETVACFLHAKAGTPPQRRHHQLRAWILTGQILHAQSVGCPSVRCGDARNSLADPTGRGATLADNSVDPAITGELPEEPVTTSAEHAKP